MDILLGFLFEMIAELILSVIGEAIAEYGIYSFLKRTGKVGNRSLQAIWYVILGFALGAISVRFVPLMVFGARTLPVIFFIVSPIFAGLGLCFANWIIKRGIDDERFLQVSKFLYGALFAFTFSMTRSIFG